MNKAKPQLKTNEGGKSAPATKTTPNPIKKVNTIERLTLINKMIDASSRGDASSAKQYAIKLKAQENLNPMQGPKNPLTDNAVQKLKGPRRSDAQIDSMLKSDPIYRKAKKK